MLFHRQAAPKQKTLKVRVIDRRLQNTILKKEGQLKRSQIFVKEFLTAKNNAVYYLASKSRSFKILHRIWTDNGRIWAVETPERQPILLKDPNYLISAIDAAIAAGVKPRMARKTRPRQRLCLCREWRCNTRVVSPLLLLSRLDGFCRFYSASDLSGDTSSNIHAEFRVWGLILHVHSKWRHGFQFLNLCNLHFYIRIFHNFLYNQLTMHRKDDHKNQNRDTYS